MISEKKKKNSKYEMTSDLSTAINKKEMKSEFLYYEKSEANKKQESFLDNDKHFSCSTPIKFDDQENVNENQEEEEIENKSLEILGKSSSLNSDKHLYNQSLFEFEEIEKNANQEENDSMSHSNNEKNILNEPIEEMEELIRKIDEANQFNVIALKSSADPSAQIKLIESENMFYDNLLKSNDDEKLNGHEAEEKFMSHSFLAKNEHIKTLQNCLEQEICKRQQCEKQLKDLYQTLVDLQQKLAIANGLDRKRQMFGKNVDLALRKILENWKKKEAECQLCFKKLNNEIKRAHENEQKVILKNEILQQDTKKLRNELIKEKVKSQEYQNEMSSLKQKLNQTETLNLENESKIAELDRNIHQLKTRNESLLEQIGSLNAQIENCNRTEIELKSDIEHQKGTNQALKYENEKLKAEYEEFIKETRNILEESEKQSENMLKSIEAEKLAKDSLQVEINMLEEKYETQIEKLVTDYENKMNRLQLTTSEKEKSTIELHRIELEQAQNKFKSDFDKCRLRYLDEIKAIKEESHEKIDELKTKIDAYLNEIERLKRSNQEMETDRNTMRQNLKKILEIQMKETMQMFGITAKGDLAMSPSTEDHKRFFNKFMLPKSNELTLEPKLQISRMNEIIIDDQKPLKIMSPKLASETNIAYASFNHQVKDSTNPNLNKSSIEKDQTKTPLDEELELYKRFNFGEKQIVVTSESSSSPSSTLEPVQKGTSFQSINIKDQFIINQIELINKQYQIDKKTIEAAVSSLASNSLTNFGDKVNNFSFSNNTSACSQRAKNQNNKVNESYSSSFVEKEREAFSAKATEKIRIKNEPLAEIDNFEMIKNMKNLNTFSALGNIMHQQSQEETEREVEHTGNKVDSNLSIVESRKIELRNFIEKLLNRSPTSTTIEAPNDISSKTNLDSSAQTISSKPKDIFLAPKKLAKNTSVATTTNITMESFRKGIERNQIHSVESFAEPKESRGQMINSMYYGDHDLSDPELGYNKRESSEYYDDVKKNLNFDDDSDESDDEESERFTNNQNKQLKQNENNDESSSETENYSSEMMSPSPFGKNTSTPVKNQIEFVHEEPTKLNQNPNESSSLLNKKTNVKKVIPSVKVNKSVNSNLKIEKQKGILVKTDKVKKLLSSKSMHTINGSTKINPSKQVIQLESQQSNNSSSILFNSARTNSMTSLSSIHQVKPSNSKRIWK